jgi:glutamate/aspartate transport system substrate-binding protein
MGASLYEPINVYKPVAPNVDIVDGPFEYLTAGGVRLPLPFTTRMTVVRLSNGDLFLHSPIKFEGRLANELLVLGAVRHLVSPNQFHYAHIGEWAKAFPNAVSWASPRVRQRARARQVDVDCWSLSLIDIPLTEFSLLANGTTDLECGSTTNNLERQKQISFTITHFVTANRFVSKKSANLKKLEDLKGKTVVSTSGTTNIKQITELNTEKNLGLNILPAKDHAEAFLMVETGRAAAFVMDDILLYSLVAGSKAPKDYEISTDALSVEPYGIMLRKDDPAFKKVVDEAMIGVYKSGEINKIYDKWFLKPVPPKGVDLNVPMSDAFKKVVAKPTDSGDPKDYQ